MICKDKYKELVAEFEELINGIKESCPLFGETYKYLRQRGTYDDYGKKIKDPGTEAFEKAEKRMDISLQKAILAYDKIKKKCPCEEERCKTNGS
ncbi:MAG: hypothetical protein ACE5J5_07305 [Candidatus Hydrothermarchaeales archaeon]